MSKMSCSLRDQLKQRCHPIVATGGGWRSVVNWNEGKVEGRTLCGSRSFSGFGFVLSMTESEVFPYLVLIHDVWMELSLPVIPGWL